SSLQSFHFFNVYFEGSISELNVPSSFMHAQSAGELKRSVGAFMHALKRRAFANKLVYLFSKKQQ
ncbi:hypothetical protein D9748_11770, partial [Staphylococcus aureus]